MCVVSFMSRMGSSSPTQTHHHISTPPHHSFSIPHPLSLSSSPRPPFGAIPTRSLAAAPLVGCQHKPARILFLSPSGLHFSYPPPSFSLFASLHLLAVFLPGAGRAARHGSVNTHTKNKGSNDKEIK